MRSRTLQVLKFAKVILLCVTLILSLNVSAQNFILNNNGDTHASNAASSALDGIGNITLRSAVEAATAQAGTHIITIPASITTINLSLGQLSLGSSSSTNITINGPGMNVLTINQTTAARVFTTTTQPNFNFTLQDMTITYTGPATTFSGGGGALLAGGTGAVTTVNRVKCTNWKNQIGNGGAIGVTFSSVSHNFNMADCVFDNNKCGGTGGAVTYDGLGTVVISGCTFTNNSTGVVGANTGGSGGALSLSGQAPGGTYSVTKCTFLNNNAENNTSQGGALIHINGQLTLNYNRFVGNTASTASVLFQSGGSAANTVDARNNWWGHNTAPTSAEVSTGPSPVTAPDVSTWLQLKLSASPATLCATTSPTTSLVTASFLNNSAGTAISVANLTALIGLPITYSAVLGTLSGAQTTIQASSTATVTFTSNGTAGAASVNGVVDNVPNNDATAKASITVNAAPSVTTNPTNVTVCAGNNATFTAAFSGTPTPTVQWQVSTDGGSNFNNVAGATSTTLTFATSASQNGNQYRCVATNTCGSATTTAATLTVNTASSVTTNPTDATVCAGSNATFTAAFSGNPVPTVQWQVSTNGGSTFNNIAGATSTTLTFTTIASQNGNQYRCVATNICGSATTTAATLTVNTCSSSSQITDYFRTRQSGNWNVPATWESSPVSDFSSGLVSPATLSPDYNGNTITVRHNVNVTAAVTIDQTVINVLDTLFVNPNIVLTVTGGSSTGITISPGAGINPGGNLTIRSTSAGTGSIGNSSGGINGDVSVERYISSAGNRAYRLICPTVNSFTSKPWIRDNWQEGTNNPNTSANNNPYPGYGTHITGSQTGGNGFDATQTGQASLFTYDAASQAWIGVANTTHMIDGATGYLLYVRGDRSVDLNTTTGSTNTTLRTMGYLIQGTRNYSTSTPSGGFGLVGNPYASAINWSSIYTNNSANLENYYTYWDPNISSRGGYVTVTNTGTSSPATGATTDIQSGEAFFVQAKAGINSPAVTIREIDKSTTNNIDVFRTTTPASQKFTTSLYYNDAEHGRRLADGVTSLYDDSYNKNLDGNDAEEIPNWDENIAIAREGKYLSIEERPTITANDTLSLYMSNMKQQSYEFEFNPTGLNPNTVAVLMDNYTGGKTYLDVTAKTVVPFSVTSAAASSATDRFYILFKTSGALPVTLTQVKAYQKNAGVEIEWTTQQENNIDHYEVERSQNGQQFNKIGAVNATGNSSSITNYSLFDAAPFNGVNYYRIKIIDRSGQVTYSAVVKVNISSKANQITVTPNPVHSNTVMVQMINMQKGSYTLSLTNKLGQVIALKVIDHAGGSTTESVTPSKVFAAGVYQLKVTGNGISVIQQVLKD